MTGCLPSAWQYSPPSAVKLEIGVKEIAVRESKAMWDALTWKGSVFLWLIWLLRSKVGTRKAALRWVALAGIILFGSVSLFSGWEGARSAADLMLPFKVREVVVAKTYYREGQHERGALPETGGWHLVTVDGNDYELRASLNGRRLQPGRYTLQLSHFKQVVMLADQIRCSPGVLCESSAEEAQR